MKAAFTSSAWLVLYFFNDVPPSLKYISSGSEPGFGIIYHIEITSMMVDFSTCGHIWDLFVCYF